MPKKQYPKVCKHCNKNFSTEDKRVKFCSRNCSGKFNNPKNIYKCTNCNIIISKGWTSAKYCDICRKTSHPQHKDWSQITLKEFSKNRPYFQVNARIRSLSRQEYNNHNKPKYCVNCKYSKHYNVCHIKPVKDFKQTDTIATINHIDNLVSLCPNCHWEFDNDYINLPLQVPDVGIEPTL